MSLTIGVELEMVGCSRKQIAQTVHQVIGGSLSLDPGLDPTEELWEIRAADGDPWYVVDDASLSGTTHERGELNTPILTEDDLPLLVTVADALRSAGARVDVTCGMHVHIGASPEIRPIRNLVDWMTVNEAQWIADLGVHPARLRHHAKPMDAGFKARYAARPPDSSDAFWECWYGTSGWRQRRRDTDHEMRYHGLNFHSLHFNQTIEFRYFNGTLDSQEIRSHAETCLSIMRRSGFSPAETP